jgi:hypothetical protein
VVSGVVAAPAAACTIALLTLLGVPAAGLEDLPVLMVLLWGVVVALILAGPGGLVLGGCVGWWIQAQALPGFGVSTAHGSRSFLGQPSTRVSSPSSAS